MKLSRPSDPPCLNPIPDPDAFFDVLSCCSREFERLIEGILLNPNLGAGIDVSGVSGGGKSNFAEWTALKSLQLGIPFLAH
ncbi:MAG: hypothetical protein R3B91_16060 [Planctomycetaceae bacterium]